MIQEDYVSFEVVDLLKKYDFPFVWKDFKVPTQALVLKWLRIKYNIHIDVACYYNPHKLDKMFYEIAISSEHNGFEGLMQNASNRINIDWVIEPKKYWLFDSPEEGIEEAIKYTLLNLIK